MRNSYFDYHLQKKEQKLAQEQRSASQLGANGTKQINGKSPERSDSPTSTSTATSVGTLTPPSLRKCINMLCFFFILLSSMIIKIHVSTNPLISWTQKLMARTEVIPFT